MTIKSVFQRLSSPIHWLFLRLPKPFSIPLLLVAILYFLFLFPVLLSVVVPNLIRKPLATLAEYVHSHLAGDSTVWGVMGKTLEFMIRRDVSPILQSLVTLLLAILGVLASHWVAGQFYTLYRSLTRKKIETHEPILPAQFPSTERPKSDNPLARYHRIGIILSGGGAKGAYQAGAMKAIYEFLEEYNAHKNVQMIAGTSIGSWNALFWLAGLVKSNNGKPGPLERWWSEVNVQKLILPTIYIPTQQNYLLSNEPWREHFDGLFRETKAGDRLLYHAQNPEADDAVRFYFTHSNIGKAHLAFTTNRSHWKDVTANLPTRRSRPVVGQGTFRTVHVPENKLRTLQNIQTGVFSSMDIPPLFPYTPIDNEYFEDGGVIDNLPIRFGTEVEECDLLFILPLNASFERKVDTRSLIRRLARVTEIRQGVLERNAFKMIYLFNELASLRERVKRLEKKVEKSHADVKLRPVEKIADRAVTRQHKVVHVFSICPAPELIIGTTEFWKTREAGEAFRFMYEVTKNELKRFKSLVNSNQIRMVLVSPVNDSVDRANNNGTVTMSVADDRSSFDACKPIRKVAGSTVYDCTYFKDF